MKLKGRILLFDAVNCNRDIFPKDCKITIPEKVPLTWNFNHRSSIGFAEVTRDDKGLIVTAETFSNAFHSDKDLKSVFDNGKFGVGGFYGNVKIQEVDGLKVVKESCLWEVALVLAPVHEEYYLEIVEDDTNE